MHEMPKFKTIEAEPHEVRSDRTRHNARTHLIIALVAVGFLVWIWTIRETVPPDALFVGTATFAVFAGAGLVVWLNQWRGV